MKLEIIIAILKHAKYINLLSWLLFIIIAFTATFMLPIKLALLLVASAFLLLIIENYYAIRIILDYDFFKILQDHSPNTENLIKFDQALNYFKLKKSIDPSKTRDLNCRMLSTIALIKRQILYLVLQICLYPIVFFLILIII